MALLADLVKRLLMFSVSLFFPLYDEFSHTICSSEDRKHFREWLAHSILVMEYPHSSAFTRLEYTELSPSPMNDVYLMPCFSSLILKPSTMMSLSIAEDDPSQLRNTLVGVDVQDVYCKCNNVCYAHPCAKSFL